MKKKKQVRKIFRAPPGVRVLGLLRYLGMFRVLAFLRMRQVLKWGIVTVLVWIMLCFSLVFLYRFANPYATIFVVAEQIRLGEIKQHWTPIEDFSLAMPRSVVAAEDADFCTHFGFDFDAIVDAFSDRDRLRGGSTISQQVAKNVFLWQARSWLRKVLEAWFTLLIEFIWPKERILEVYLNVAEMDEGVFGAAAAARHYFGVEPDRITATHAARLAAILPSPKTRSASRPTHYIRKRTAQIISGAQTIAQDGRAKCFESG